MTFIPLPGMPDPQLDRERLLTRVVAQALRINDKLLAKVRKPARKRKAAA